MNEPQNKVIEKFEQNLEKVTNKHIENFSNEIQKTMGNVKVIQFHSEFSKFIEDNIDSLTNRQILALGGLLQLSRGL